MPWNFDLMIHFLSGPPHQLALSFPAWHFPAWHPSFRFSLSLSLSFFLLRFLCWVRVSGDAGFLGWIKYETLGETIVTSLRVKLGCLVRRLMSKRNVPDTRPYRKV